MAASRTRESTRTRLLATDLDGTFIGADAPMDLLWQRLDEHGILLAFSTGRHLASIREFYGSRDITRRARACLCMVGTEIWHLVGDDTYVVDDEWSGLISTGWDQPGVEAILTTIPEAVLQPAEWQSPFKSSYFLEDNANARLAEIENKLATEGLRAKIVYSADRFLDLLPHRSGKGEAVRYLAKRLGVDPANVITAGDTGNDLDMMRPELGFRAIAVGNAAPELQAYRPPNVYHATADHAAGIEEGLQHYGWLPMMDVRTTP